MITAISNLYRAFLATQTEFLTATDYFKSFYLGVTFDISVAVYTFVPYFILFLFFFPRKNSKGVLKNVLIFLLGYELFILLFSVVSEYLFFLEFNDRFNFIAVDYLVYTNEVLRNIWESYHLVPIVLSMLAVTVGLTYLFYKKSYRFLTVNPLTLKQKAFFTSIYVAIFALSLQTVNENQLLSKLQYSDDIMIAKNGLHSLFAAYRNNEIRYSKYYPNMPGERAESLVYEALKSAEDKEKPLSTNEDNQTFIRNIVAKGSPNKKNVVIVLMESLSAKYLGANGNTQSLTPNIDRLTTESLYLDHAYSTGTRTVRGIEAITLSIPPTPGQSIVRRPAGTHLFNIGTVFKDNGYENKFIYGGNALFDNMADFFSGNGFTVVDSDQFTKEEINFETAWGVCDEDLFNKVLTEADLSYAKKTPFFNFVLTTSNHRPYTFPENKIDIKPGTGRDGAIKYSDYAIGEFLKAAEKRPWFKDTVFVFVSDHNASVAGNDNIKIEDYHIPVIFYSPSFIKPKTISRLTSQIDVAPTLLSLLNFSYQSKFFGVDANQTYPPRAFIGTYKKIAYYNNEDLIILSPTNMIQENASLPYMRDNITPTDKETIQTAVAFYKTASRTFRKGLLKEDIKYFSELNKRR